MAMKNPAHPVVWLQPGAPPKPAYGAPCNGCGLCCLAAPCPLGMLVSRRRTGACAALRWDAEAQHYRCGLLSQPGEFLPRSWPWLLRATQAVTRRHIAAGRGCDAHLEAEAADRDAI